MAVVGIPILVFSQYIVYPILLSLLALAALFEMLRAFGVEKNYFISVPAYLIALAAPVIAFFFRAQDALPFILFLAAGLFIYLIYLFFIAVFKQGELKFSNIAEAFAAVVYIVMSFAALSIIRYLENGIFILIMILIAAWGSDVFAYFTGMLIGRHKLIPRVSPKKTVEGAIGGVVFATLLMLLYGFIVSLTTDLEPNYIVLGACGFLLSMASQIGDLIASLIKRENEVKDYGNIFPGHGGVMDRFDSVISITTVLMVICIVFPPFA